MSQEVMRLFSSINKQGITVVVVTHDHDFIRKFGKRVITLEDGEVAEDWVYAKEEGEEQL